MIKVNRLRGRWTELGYSQKEVAAHLGVGADTFISWMKNRRLRSDYIVALAELLEIDDYNYFFTDEFDCQ